MKKQFVQAIFCAPTGDYKDKPYPSRLTDEVFLALSEAGINRIFGFGYDSRKETVEKTFELCEKYGIGYCPTPVIQGAYTRVVPGEDGRKPFYEMTEQEIAELDKQFLAEVEPWAKHKAFAGIFFSDEAGYLAAEGIAHAKKVFDEYYGKYEFHTNFYSYSINEAIFWGGMSGDIPHKLPFELTGDMAITFQNRFHFYDRLVDNLYSREKLSIERPHQLLIQIHIMIHIILKAAVLYDHNHEGGDDHQYPAHNACNSQGKTGFGPRGHGAFSPS